MKLPPPCAGPSSGRPSMMKPKTEAALQRHATTRRGGLDFGQRLEPFAAFAHQLTDSGGLREALPRQRHAHRQHSLGIESRIDGTQRDVGANQQRGADQQDQRERDFGDHEHGARLVLFESGTGSSGALLHDGAEVDASGTQGREQSEHEPGQQRHEGREGEHAAVDAHRRTVDADAGNVAGIERQQGANADDAERQAEQTAQQRQHQALGHQLARDAAARGADRCANRDFALADGRAHEQQVGHVRARNQQHETHRAHQNPQRRSHVAHDHLLQCLDAEPDLWRQRLRKRLTEFGGSGRKLRGAAFDGDSRLQSSSRREEIPLHGAVGIDLERQPDLRCADRRLDGGRIERSQHADDLVRLAVEQDRAPDHARVTAKSTLPETVAEHHGEPTAGPIFFRREGAAVDRGGAKEAEEINADVGRRDLFGIRIACDVDHAEAIGRDILKSTCLTPPDIELRRRRGPTGALGRDVEKHHQPLGIRIRQRLQDDGVEDRKNRRVRADPEGQRGHGSKRESGRVAQEPEGLAQVLNECVHLLSPALWCCRVLRHQPGTVGRHFGRLLWDRLQ